LKTQRKFLNKSLFFNSLDCFDIKRNVFTTMKNYGLFMKFHNIMFKSQIFSSF